MAKRNNSWRTWSVGDRIRYFSDDPMDHFDCTGIVKMKEHDHLIVTVEKDTNLWVDDDNADDFQKLS